MKKLLLFSICIASTIAYSQTTVLSENFNNGFPSGWQLIDNDNAAPYNSPSVNFISDAFVIYEDYDSLGIGDSILIATSWLDDSSIDADDYLILPAVTLGGGGNKLHFETKSIDQSYPDGIQLLYTLNDLTVDTILANGVLFDTIASPAYWTQFTVNLDTLNLQNETVNFVFRHYGNDQFILALDNVSIVIDDPSSTITDSFNTISLYPNPSKDIIFIDGLKENAAFKIYNTQGQLVKQGTSTGRINHDLEIGMYILSIKQESIKFIVE